MINKVFNSSNFETHDLSNFHYLRPKRIQTEGPSPAISRVYYEEEGKRMNICFETDTFNLMNGVQRTPSGIHYIDFYFNGNDSFFDFINLINELNIDKTYENSKRWFNKQIDLDLIDTYYKHPLRADRRTREKFIRLRVDAENLDIHNQYGKNLVLEDVCSNIKTKIQVRFDGIQILRQNFFPLFNVSEITVYEKKKYSDNQEFLDEDNGLPNLLDTNVNFEETEQDFQSVRQSLRDNNLNSNTHQSSQETEQLEENQSSQETEQLEEHQTEEQETEQLEEHQTEEQETEQLEEHQTEEQETEQLEEHQTEEQETEQLEEQETEQLEEHQTEEYQTEEQETEQLEEHQTEEQETEQLEEQETEQLEETERLERETEGTLEEGDLEQTRSVQQLDGFLRENEDMISSEIQSEIKREVTIPADEQTELIEFFKNDNEEELTRKTQRLVQTLLRRQQNDLGSETSSRRLASVSIKSSK